MNLTSKKLTKINLGVLAALAPVLIVAANNLPAKYVWLAPFLLQLGNWLLQNKALKTQNPNIATRRALSTAYEMAYERDKDLGLMAQQLCHTEVANLNASQVSILIRQLKSMPIVRKAKPNPATIPEAISALKDSEVSK